MFNRPGSHDRDGLAHRAFGVGRKLAAVDLRLVILALLAGKPHHGYEIIKALDQRSNGYYRPSPGMVYPALGHLLDLGHVTVEVAGARKIYSATSVGQDHLDANRAAASDLMAQFARAARRMGRMRLAMDDDRQSPDAIAGSSELQEAWTRLLRALNRPVSGSAEAERRTVDILDRATAAILEG